jgi:hypothetical protein
MPAGGSGALVVNNLSVTNAEDNQGVLLFISWRDFRGALAN